MAPDRADSDTRGNVRGARALAMSVEQLHPQHAALLRASAISLAVAEARGYRSVIDSAEMLGLGFSAHQAPVPAMVIPIHTVHGVVGLHQLRPDTPRVVGGKAIKYETPAGARLTLDVPPSARPGLRDPRLPLWITEGVRKADAAASKGLCVVGLLGVFGWRGSNEFGGKTALADWELIALNDRIVYVAFDSDVMTKPEVQGALARLKGFLESRGAHVRLVYLPAGSDGSKVGLDDFFAARGTIDDLLGLATTDLRPPAALFHSSQSSSPGREERILPFRTARAVGEAVPRRSPGTSRATSPPARSPSSSARSRLRERPPS